MAIKVFVERPSFMEFYREFCGKNLPCILPASITNFWRSRNEWVFDDGRPNLDFMKQHFGLATVCVTDCSNFETSNTSVADFLDSNDQSLLYIKDWHFQTQYPEYSAYETPLYFQSDWLNEYFDYKQNSIEKDYRFVYIGQQGTCWSANICGRKLWYLVPPGLEKAFKNCKNDLDLYGGSIDLRKCKLDKNFENVITYVQNPGEIIFVPSDWYHQVHNLDFTISINHNWFNGANIEKVWFYLKRKLNDVKREIEHCKNLLDNLQKQYQQILKADVGIDYSEFKDLLNFVESNRLREMTGLEYEDSCYCTCNDRNFCDYCRTIVCEHDLLMCNRLSKEILIDADFISIMNKG